MKNYKQKFYKVLKEIKQYSISFYGNRLVSLVVFGSVAKDTFSPVSDIDLLVVLKDKKSSYHYYQEFFDNIIQNLSYKNIQINPIFKTPETMSVELPYLWDTKFLLLYDKDGFFSNFIKTLDKFKMQNLKFKNNYIEISR